MIFIFILCWFAWYYPYVGRRGPDNQ